MQHAGLARWCTAEAFAAICYQVRWDGFGDDADIRDRQAQVQVRTVDVGTTIAALALPARSRRSPDLDRGDPAARAARADGRRGASLRSRR